MVRRIAVLLALMLLVAGARAQSAREVGSSPERLRAFYFGNSLTGCTNPQWHSELGKGAGKQWEAEAFLGAGWQLWQHRRQLGSPEEVFSADSKGDLTIDREFVRSAPYKARNFYEGAPWDAIVLQPFGQALERVVTEIWGSVTFEEPTDVGDIASSADLINLYLRTNPGGAGLHLRGLAADAARPGPAGRRVAGMGQSRGRARRRGRIPPAG